MSEEEGKEEEKPKLKLTPTKKKGVQPTVPKVVVPPKKNPSPGDGEDGSVANFAPPKASPEKVGSLAMSLSKNTDQAKPAPKEPSDGAVAPPIASPEKIGSIAQALAEGGAKEPEEMPKMVETPPSPAELGVEPSELAPDADPEKLDALAKSMSKKAAPVPKTFLPPEEKKKAVAKEKGTTAFAPPQASPEKVGEVAASRPLAPAASGVIDRFRHEAGRTKHDDELFTDAKDGNPNPGLLELILYAFFKLPRFAALLVKGLKIPVPVFVMIIILTGISILASHRGVFVPIDPGIESLADWSRSDFWGILIFKSIFAGPIIFVLGGAALRILVKFSGGDTEMKFASEMALYGLLPLTVMRLGFLVWASSTFGEAYWRGYLPQDVQQTWLYISMGVLALCSFHIFLAIRKVCGIEQVKGLVLTCMLPFVLMLGAEIGVKTRAAKQYMLTEHSLDLARNSMVAGAYKQAAKDFAKALETVPFENWELRSRLRMTMGESLHLQNKRKEAGMQFLRVYRMLPDTESLHQTSRGAIRLLGSDLEKAKQALQAGHRLNAKDHSNLRYLARLNLGEYGGDPDPVAAETYAEHVWRIDPSALHGALLVDALFQQEKYLAVSRIMRELSWEKATHGKTLYQGGMAWYKLGKKEAASVLFEAAVRKDNSYADDPIVDRLIGTWSWDANAPPKSWPMP